ncbi:hypothetical protein JCM19037_2078 [Geomicrobium sp. JCM 19037]|nr:hypothetical protein JCM19037_2078 [Geomicrobium sp. JCM 19037]
MRKLLPLLSVLVLVLSACGTAEEEETTESQEGEVEEITLEVATLIPPMTEILELAQSQLEEDG